MKNSIPNKDRHNLTRAHSYEPGLFCAWLVTALVEGPALAAFAPLLLNSEAFAESVAMFLAAGFPRGNVT